MNDQAVVAGGSADVPQARPVASGVLAVQPGQAEPFTGAWPRLLTGEEWQMAKTAVDLLSAPNVQGRTAWDLFEVRKDETGCLHIIIGRPKAG